MTHNLPEEIQIDFIAGFGPVVTDMEESRRLYCDTLGMRLDPVPKYGIFHSFDLPGVKYFALWPLEGAAKSCFGTDTWPDNVPEPQSWLEVEVKDIERATRILDEAGYDLFTRMFVEPWGQIATRFLTPEGILISVCYHPDMHETS